MINSTIAPPPERGQAARVRAWIRRALTRAPTGHLRARGRPLQYNAAGKVTNESVSASGLSSATTREYDLAKRITRSVDPAGLTNLWTYSADCLTTTNTLPGGATRIQTDYECAYHKSVTGSAAIGQYYDLGPNSDGSRWETTYTATDNGPRWTKTTKGGRVSPII